MNNFTCIGRLGGDPVIRQSKEGEDIASFNVAVNSGYGKNKATTWFKVSLFGKRASVSQYLEKGKRVGVTGEVVLRSFTGKDGTEQSSLEISNANIFLIDSVEQGQETAKPKQESQPAIESNFDPFGDNVPF